MKEFITNSIIQKNYSTQNTDYDGVKNYKVISLTNGSNKEVPSIAEKYFLANYFHVLQAVR